MIKTNASVTNKEVFTIEIILADVFQCLVDEVYAPQSLRRKIKKRHFIISAKSLTTETSQLMLLQTPLVSDSC